MHEAKWNREKDEADNRRTRGSILRAAFSKASNERTSRLYARAVLFEHVVVPELVLAVPVLLESTQFFMFLLAILGITLNCGLSQGLFEHASGPQRCWPTKYPRVLHETE